MRTPCRRTVPAAVLAAAVLAAALVAGGVRPALADARDISVGGVWICRITHDVPGHTSYERATEVNKRITQVLSNTNLRQGAVVAVRRMDPDATVWVGDILVFTVTPEDAEGKSTVDTARSWAQALAKGLGQALPGSEFYF